MSRSLLTFVSIFTIQFITLSDAVPAFDRRDNAVTSASSAATVAATSTNPLVSLLGTLSVNPTSTPTSVPQAVSIAGSIAINSTSPLDQVTQLVANGLVATQNIAALQDQAEAGDNLAIPKNPAPKSSIYPKASPSDAPYDLTEAQLRSVIRIPYDFTYGRKPPVILVPGTGSTGYLTFAGNFLETLSNVNYADPVWLQIPHFMLDDAQVNAEYVAYAINYISSITSRNTSIIAWSQGNLGSQWALKYWPSTRSKVSDLVSISPDFHGTVLAAAVCTPLVGGCPPAFIQQVYTSNFITTLRAGGGDSAYVPTTTVYSETDEIVQPQQGTAASAFILDARGVGVSNTDIQLTCPGRPAGGVVTHEGALANALSYALAVDALKQPGPGSLARINVAAVCAQVIAPGLGLDDFIETESNIITAALSFLLYQPKVIVEPPIKAYALQ